MKKTFFNRFTACVLSCMMLSAFSFTAFAEESVTTPPLFGDTNNDGIVNAVDAANTLFVTSLIGCDPATIDYKNEFGIDYQMCEVNGDDFVDAKDAAVVLRYTTAIGSGYTGTLSDFVENEE